MNNFNQPKSYVRYTGLFNKVCSSPIFLVLAGLTSLYCLFAVINFFTSLAGGLGGMFGIVAILINALPVLFAVLSTIGVWMMYLGATKNNIGAGNIGLASSLPKWNQVIKTISVVVAIIAIILVVALLFMAQAAIGEAMGDAGEAVGDASDMVDEIAGSVEGMGIDAETVKMVKDALGAVGFLLVAGPIVIAIIGLIAIAVMIIEIIRFSTLCKFLNGAQKMYKTGHMVAPPSMFFVITTFIFAGIGLIGSIGIIPLTTFNLAGLVYPAMMAIVGVIMMQNKDELANIYAAWQSEIGMINPGVNTGAPQGFAPQNFAAPQAPQQETPVATATEENNTDAQ